MAYPKGGFWTNPKASAMAYAPKQQARFKVFIDGFAFEDDETTGQSYKDGDDGSAGLVWYIKTIDKPKLEIQTIEMDDIALGDKVVVPKIADVPTWKPITMVMVDPSYPNATRKIARLFRRAGYLDEEASKINGHDTLDFSREVLVASTGKVQIVQIDTNGTPLETWELNGAMPTSVDFGKLDYGSDDLVEISITWTYTSAFVTMHGQGAAGNPKHGGEAMGTKDGYDGQMTERSFTYYKDYNEAQSEHTVESETDALGSFN